MLTSSDSSATQKKNILITGGTGLIGTGLVKKLQESGHQVSVLSRNPAKIKNVKAYRWDIKKQEIDSNCLTGIDTIIHLAGENIGEKRWTEKQKKNVIESRVLSIGLLYKAVKETKSSIETIISTSAVGFYGDRENEVITEESGRGIGFLPECCQAWEDAVDKGIQFGSRIVKLRIGLLLSKYGGALPVYEKSVRYFVGAPLGSGKQWISWIHYDDLLSIFEEAIENTNYQGAYNVSTPFPVTNAMFTKILAKELHRPVWPIKVPKVVLKIILGEMSSIVLMSTRTSSKKLLDERFVFRYNKLEEALTALT